MKHCRLSLILFVIAGILAIIAIITGLIGGSKNGDLLSPNDQQNMNRANMFFMAAIAISLLAIYLLWYEMKFM